MTRHRKFIKSEKTKTKLKGAKLPKGLNVTKTEFKVRKIVIRDQIKDPTVIGDGTIVKSNIKVWIDLLCVGWLAKFNILFCFAHKIYISGFIDKITTSQCNQS